MKALFLIFFIWIVLVVVVINVTSTFRNTSSSTCAEHSEHELEGVNPVMRHHRSWLDFDYDVHCIDFSIKDSLQTVAKKYRKELSIRYQGNYVRYWGKVYDSLILHEKDGIYELISKIGIEQENNQWNRTTLAQYIVTMIQDIPYEYILSKNCDSTKSNHPCNGNVKFGLFGPTEFLYQLAGDCDTRSVLLYAVLKEFGFNPLILISRQYLHAMLALDIPATGKHITHKGSIYYFWETTNIGWKPGMLGAGMSNLKYWNVALD